ncbi:MAG: phosphotransferase [Pseudomonadota bacterium]
MIPPLEAWGVSGDVRPLTGGHRNTVMRAGGYVLKTTRRSEAALRWLGPVHERAAACGLGAPRLIESRAGTLLVDGWTCEPFCDGRPTGVQEIRSQVSAFHSCGAGGVQRPGFASARDLVTRTAGGDVDLSKMPASLVARLRDAWADLSGADVAIHADLNPSNILKDAEGRICLIDWDEARVDAPLFDTAQTDHAARRAWEIACCWTVEPVRARALARAF